MEVPSTFSVDGGEVEGRVYTVDSESGTLILVTPTDTLVIPSSAVLDVAIVEKSG